MRWLIVRVDKYLAIRIGEQTHSMAEWMVKNPVLLAGEFGIESDTLRMKIGDGSTPWNQLKYLQSAGSQYIAG